MRSRLSFLALAAILIITGLKYFIELTDDYFENDLNRLDSVTANFIESFRNEPLTIFMRVFTKLGDNTTYVIVIIAMLFYYRRTAVYIHILRILIVILVSFAISYLLKEIIDRPRPEGTRLISVITKSFPSGHAFSAATFYPLLIYFLFKYRFRFRILLSFVCILIILLMGISRVYLGVHYTSDVLAGYCAGLFLVGVTIILNEVYGQLRHDKKKLS